MKTITSTHWLAHLGLLPMIYVAFFCTAYQFPKMSAVLSGLITVYFLFFLVCAFTLDVEARWPSQSRDWLAFLGVPSAGLLVIWCDHVYQSSSEVAQDTVVVWMGLGTTFALVCYLMHLQELFDKHHAENDYFEVNPGAKVCTEYDDTKPAGDCIACWSNHPNVSWADCKHVVYCMTCYLQSIEHGGDGKCPYCKKGKKVKRLAYP